MFVAFFGRLWLQRDSMVDFRRRGSLIGRRRHISETNQSLLAMFDPRTTKNPIVERSHSLGSMDKKIREGVYPKIMDMEDGLVSLYNR